MKFVFKVTSTSDKLIDYPNAVIYFHVNNCAGSYQDNKVMGAEINMWNIYSLLTEPPNKSTATWMMLQESMAFLLTQRFIFKGR